MPGCRTATGAAAPVAIASLLAAAPAAAHVTLQPAASRPAELQRYTVYVPNERRAATTGVAIRVPAGIDFVLVESRPGWRARLVRESDRIAELRWSGGRIAPDGYAELHFIARNPVRAGAIAWPTLQRYADGTVVRWIGSSSSSSQPAPRVRVSEAATPVDVVSTHGEVAADGRASPDGGTKHAPSATEDGDGEGGLALSIVALVVAIAALAVALRGRRRPG